MLTSCDLPLYQQLARHYQQAMVQGALAAGQRMPSVRVLMERHGVSLSTALHMLRYLEEQGSLEARPRVGYFVRNEAAVRLDNVSEPDLSAPFPIDEQQFVGVNDRISWILERGRRAGLVVDLGGATPPATLFDRTALNRQAAQLLREQPDVLVQGRLLQGTHAEFQEAMVRRALVSGWSLPPSEVLSTTGNSEAVSLALAAVTQPGDVIAVESPTYYGLLQAIESHKLQTLEIPCSPHTGISLEALELAFRGLSRPKAVVVVPDLQMPQGTRMPDSHKARLAALCNEYGVVVIEDDSYGLFVETSQPVRPVKAWDTTGNVIYCESFNKSLAPGLRQGWIHAGRWHSRVQMIKFAQSRVTQTFAQLLVARSVGTPAYERHMERLKLQLRRQREGMAQWVARYFPVGTRLSLPPGGMCLWMELPQGVSTSALFGLALEKGIRIAPGAMFSNTGRYERFMRLGCTQPLSAELEAACKEVGHLAQEAVE